MFAFVRVFAFYVTSAALLTWGLFAMGWADALEMEGFSNTPVVEQSRQPPQPIAVGPLSDPVPKSALPREARAPVAEPVTPARVPWLEPKVAVVVAPAAPAPVASAPPAAVGVGVMPAVPASPVAPSPSARVAAYPLPERAPAPVIETMPEPVRTFPRPAVDTRKAPPIVALPAKPNSVVAPQPVRQADVAPVTPPYAPAAAPTPPAARPMAAPQPDAVRSPARAALWAPVRRIAGFGHDALVDQLEDTRHSAGDVPCVVMRELTFKAGTPQFHARVNQELATVAKVLALFPERRVEIGSRLGPGRPLPSDAKLRADRAQAVRTALIRLGIAADKLLPEPGDGYDRAADDLTRAGASRVQSIGLCVRDI